MGVPTIVEGYRDNKSRINSASFGRTGVDASASSNSGSPGSVRASQSRITARLLATSPDFNNPSNSIRTMARINNFLSKASANNTKARGFVTAVNKLSGSALALLVAATFVTGTTAAHAASSSKTPSVIALKVQDPLAGDAWHAVQSSWPGTLVFDSAKKIVTLAPVGANPMSATYSYTVKPAAADKAVEGTLRMTNTEKQVSDSSFRIEGKSLVLIFANGQRVEQYVRMTPKEEAAEKAKLEKLISEGRIRPLK